ncbi:MAG: ATP-binding protein [Chitinophagales bacterium]
MKKINRLLARQIKRTFGGIDNIPPEIVPLLEKVNQSYEHFEEDRRLLERAMDISSEELKEANVLLRAESKKQAQLLEELKDTLSTLWSVDNDGHEMKIAEDNDLLEIADMLKKQSKRIKEVEEELSYVNDELKNFAYIVSHDLKAPLRAIGSLTDWMITDYGDKLDKEGLEYLDLIKMRIVRMNNLIEGILQYSRAGKKMSKLKPMDLNKVVEEVLFMLNPPPHFQINIKNELPTVACEPTKVNQVFQNLISNAIKYNDKPVGILDIGYDEVDGTMHFYVADNGPGIEEKYHEKIFEIFQTLNARDDIESTGVGLTVVKKIIESNNGRIWLTSTLHEGTVFHFNLPNSLKCEEDRAVINT